MEPPPSNHQEGVRGSDDDHARHENEFRDSSDGSNHQGDSKGCSKTKSKKKRGADRRHITLGGLKRVEKATKRKVKQKINKKLGSLGIPSSREKNDKRRGPPPPTRSVCFIDNTANGVLVKRF